MGEGAEVTSAAAGIAQALASLAVLPIGSEGCGMACLKASPRTMRPAREAVGPVQEGLDTASLIATRLEPARAGIQGGTGGGRAVVLQRQRDFEIGREHAALLHESPCRTAA
jgi:hypothetical protein